MKAVPQVGEHKWLRKLPYLWNVNICSKTQKADRDKKNKKTRIYGNTHMGTNREWEYTWGDKQNSHIC